VGKGWFGKLIGFCVATALLSPLWFPVAKLAVEDKKWDRVRQDVSTICQKETAELPEIIPVDSFAG
jgi:hypothetical protein